MSEAARAGALTDTEREVSQRLSQGFAWPTVLLFVALIAIEGAVIAAWAVGAMPLLLGMFINSVACYGLYTVVHDSVHKIREQPRSEVCALGHDLRQRGGATDSPELLWPSVEPPAASRPHQHRSRP